MTAETTPTWEELRAENERLRMALQMIYDGYSAGESRAFMSVAAYEALESVK